MKLYEAIAKGTPPPVATPKKKEHPTITVGTDLYRVVCEGIDALSNHPNTYQRGVLVEVVHDAKKPAKCLHDNGTPRLRPIPYPTLEVKLSHSPLGKAEREGWRECGVPATEGCGGGDCVQRALRENTGRDRRGLLPRPPG